MKQIILTVDDSFPMIELMTALRQMGLTLRMGRSGVLEGYPINAEQHGNSNVVRLPRHKRQIMRTTLPTGPSAA